MEALFSSSLPFFGLLVAFGMLVGARTNFLGVLILNVLFLAGLGFTAVIVFGMTQADPERVFLGQLTIVAALCVPMTLVFCVRQWIPKA